MNIVKRFISSLLLLLCSIATYGQDSIKSVILQQAEIIATSLEEKQRQLSGDAVSGEQISKSGIQSVGEAAKFLSGVSVKDYGGTGGLKTVSVRGLGSMHTNVTYDGISIGNAQNGQIDLSKFRTDNLENLSLSNGNPISRLQTAKSLAAANTLSMESRKPGFSDSNNINGFLSLSAGSFNLGNLKANINTKFSKKLSANIYIDMVSCEGDYPYLLRYGPNPTDSTSNERRENNDFFSLQSEANIFYDISPNSNLKTKIYFHHSNRGLPGPTTLYYLKSKQRLWDRDAFVQSVYQLRINKNWDYKTHFKLSEAYTRYTDPMYNNAQGVQDDRYTQQEAYWNNIISWHDAERFSLMFTNDLTLAFLQAKNNYTFDPYRFTSQSALVAAYKLDVFIFDFNILHTLTKDWAKSHKAFAPQNHFSPYASIGINTAFFDAAIFYKDIFRMPTFNDLYYNAIGEITLRPEKAKQYNLHFVFKYTTNHINYHDFRLSFDLYHNDVTDKIVAVPRNNYFIWSMINYGKARMDGIEIKGEWKHERIIAQKNLCITASAVYNYTYAIDNDKESPYYKQQIQYTALNSANGMLNIDYANTTLSYGITYVGKRYTSNQNTLRNQLPSYADQSISVTYSIKDFDIKLSCNNFTNAQYEVIKSYPMQGRQWIVGLKYRFK